MIGTLSALYCYPIKGLSPLSVKSARLNKNDGFPSDRLFGFAKSNSGFDAAAPKPLPKDRFLVLAQQAKLAKLKTSIDQETYEFSASLSGREVLRVNLNTDEGKSAASKFFVNLLELEDDEAPFFAEAYPHRFTDVSVVSATMMNAVSFINLASVRDFESRIDKPVDPRRFRANIVVDGWPPFWEFEQIGKTISIGDVEFKVLLRTKRCAATEVNPKSAERDLKVPSLLRSTYGHFDMGVYAQVCSDGLIGVDDVVTGV